MNIYNQNITDKLSSFFDWQRVCYYLHKKDPKIMEQNMNDSVEEIKNNSQTETIPTDEPQEEAKSELDQLKENLTDEKNKFMRLYAEFDNYKKRTAKEKLELYRNASQDVILSLLPVWDDFDRGMKEINKSENEILITGVTLIQTKFHQTLQDKGLTLMELNTGDVFDTDKHEAITQVPAPTEELKNKVIDIIETGFLLNEKVIRYAKVIVGK